MKHTPKPILCATLAAASGCRVTPPGIRRQAWHDSFTPTDIGDGGSINLAALDVLASLAVLAAGVIVVLWAMRVPIPGRAAAAAVITAVAAWTLKFMMIRYIWVISALALSALAFFSVTLYRANSAEIIERLRLRRRTASTPPPATPTPKPK